MYVTPVSPNNLYKRNLVNFQAKSPHKSGFIDDNEIKNKLEKEQENNKPFSKKISSGTAAVLALSAAVLGGAVMYRRNGWRINNLEAQLSETVKKSETIKNSLETVEKKVKDLTTDNETLKGINKTLKEEIEKTKNKLTDIFEGDLAPKDVRDKILNDLKAKIDKGELGYDITQPPVTGKGGTKVYSDAVPLPSHVGTTNRAGMRGLDMPEISPDGRFDFQLPISDEVKITHMQSANFRPVQNQMTNISENYADSVRWDNNKIARDLMQNFFDGHGQTLDGVILHFEPAGNGRYKVRIEGKSTYTPDKAVYIGESTKRDNAKAAGNYGEGLKMSVLKLLRDGGADDVKIASDNWKLTYRLADGNLSDKRVLSYSLDKTDKYNGNYIEFETSDMDLLQTLKKTVNRFYHSNNKHFECPDFENAIMSIKILPQGEKGGIYMAGQRFEFNNDYDGLNGIVINIKEKLPKAVLDPSRDRTTLNTSDLENIAKWVAHDSRMTNDDKAKLLKSLEDYWDEKDYIYRTPLDKFVDRFLFYANGWGVKDFHIQFPEKYVAYSDATDDVVCDLRLNGYRVCKEDFSNIGMQTIKELLGNARAHEVVVPNDIQKKKILILKEAIQKLSPSLKDKHFTADELDTKIYLFDKTSAKDSRMYSDTLAEAITDNGKSKGFWLEKGYLDSASFTDVLETALHELSHKAGGDESAAFSYKLTNVNKDAIGQIMTDVQSRNELQALNTLWNSLS